MDQDFLDMYHEAHCNYHHHFKVVCYNSTPGRPRSYRKYILQITQTSQYRYAKLQHRFVVTFGAPSTSQGEYLN